MKNLLHHGKATVLTTALALALALGGLAASATAAPAAHAASNPSIVAYGEAGSVLVGGSGFPSGSEIRFEALSPSFTVEAVDYEQAPNGQADASLVTDYCLNHLWHSYTGTVWVVADTICPPTGGCTSVESNWQSVNVTFVSHPPTC
jgi:hypothetical protein